jgi:hypothetical protein
LASTEPTSERDILNPGCVHIKILSRVPRPVQDLIACKLSECLDMVVSTNSKESWESLFLFCRRFLYTPTRRGHRRNLAAHIRQALDDEES